MAVRLLVGHGGESLGVLLCGTASSAQSMLLIGYNGRRWETMSLFNACFFSWYNTGQSISLEEGTMPLLHKTTHRKYYRVQAGLLLFHSSSTSRLEIRQPPAMLF